MGKMEYIDIDEETTYCEECNAVYPIDDDRWAVRGEIAICKECQEKLKNLVYSPE